MMNTDRAGFPGKNLDHSIIRKRFFADSATLSGLLWISMSCWSVFAALYDRTKSLLQLCENRMSEKGLNHSIIRSKDSENGPKRQLWVHFNGNVTHRHQLCSTS